MADIPFRFGPVALTTADAFLVGATDNAITLTGVKPTPIDIQLSLRHIRIVNKSAIDTTFSLYVGTALDNKTEAIGTGTNVPANTAFDWYGDMFLDVGELLIGEASVNTRLVIQGDGVAFVTLG